MSDVGTLVYALHYCTSGNASGTHGYACNDGNILRFIILLESPKTLFSE